MESEKIVFENMENEKQIFCADYSVCPLVARQNSQKKWEFWGLSGFESGKAKHETRLLKDCVFDAVEAQNTTSGRTYIKVLQNGIPHEIVFIQNRMATPEDDFQHWHFRSSIPMYIKFFTFIDCGDDETLESFLERGAGKHKTVLIDLMEAADMAPHANNIKHLDTKIDYFLKNGIDINERDEFGNTLLFNSIGRLWTHGNIDDEFRFWLEKGANINVKNVWGETPLMRACTYLDVDYIRILLEKGANVEPKCFINTISQEDLMPTDLLDNQIEIMNLLVQNNATNHQKKTPLLSAIHSELKPIAEYHNRTNFSITDDENDDAIGRGYRRIVKLCEKENDIVFGQ
jgi:hypothetical protein